MAINGSGRFIGPGHPVRNGLIGWYDNRYKEPDLAAGSDWTDLSGAGNTMSQNGSPAWNYGYYFEMDGSDDYFRNTSMGTHTTFTLEFWGERDDTSGAEYYLDGRDSGSTSSWWWLSNYSGYDNNFNNKAYINWSDDFTDWHHTAVTDNNSTTTLYINGESVDTGTSATWSSNELTIGARYTNSSPWNGKIGCVRIYDRALSATEIRHNFLCDAGKFGVTIEGTT